MKTKTYADVVAAPNGKKTLERTTRHALVITSKDPTDTGEQVLDIIRETIKAKEERIHNEYVRKARGRKVIVGCKPIEKIKEKLLKDEEKLNAEEAMNKKSLVALKCVKYYNIDEDIQIAINTKNTLP